METSIEDHDGVLGFVTRRKPRSESRAQLECSVSSLSSKPRSENRAQSSGARMPTLPQNRHEHTAAFVSIVSPMHMLQHGPTINHQARHRASIMCQASNDRITERPSCVNHSSNQQQSQWDGGRVRNLLLERVTVLLSETFQNDAK